MSRDTRAGHRIAFGLVVLVTAATSGCVAVGATRFYGTSTVTPLPTLATAQPSTGLAVGVRVEDLRAGVHPYEVGSKRSGTWGFEASTIDLKGQVPLVAQVAQDVVAMLRDIGYRAGPADEAGGVDLLLTVRIHIFRLEAVPEASWMGGDVLVSFECRAASGRRLALDAIGLRRVGPRAGGLGIEEQLYQEQFEALYTGLRERLRQRLAEDLRAALIARPN